MESVNSYLARYEALLEFFRDVSREGQIDGLPTILQSRIKYLANILGWRYLLADRRENGILRSLAGYTCGKGKITPFNDITESEEAWLASGVNRVVTRRDIASPEDFHGLFTRPDVKSLLILPIQSGTTSKGLFVCASGQEEIPEIEIKFIGIATTYWHEKFTAVYSEELFRIQLAASRKEIEDILNNVTAGIITLGKDLIINKEMSGKTMDVFGSNPAGKNILSLFTENVQELLNVYLNQLFHNTRASEQILNAANPIKRIEYRNGTADKVLEFNFRRLRTRTDEIEKLMVVIDDKTREIESMKLLEAKMRNQAAEIEKIHQALNMDPKQIDDFRSELGEAAGSVRRILQTGGRERSEIEEILRAAHTLKGNARNLGFSAIATQIHEIEASLRLGGDIRSKLGDFMMLISQIQDEVKDRRSLLSKLIDRSNEGGADAFAHITDYLEKNVQNVATKLGKKIQFKSDISVKSNLSDQFCRSLKNILMHLTTNAVDHGIESPADRLLMNKPETGLVTLKIQENTSVLEIILEDDGAGLKTERITAKAIAAGIISGVEALSVLEKNHLIFCPGFSTAPDVTELSGRGIGLDFVRAELEKYGGLITVDSEAKYGSKFQIGIPLLTVQED